MRNAIWMSYDLGVNGDYEGMYAWLDNHGAKECGSSVAFLMYEHDAEPYDELVKELRRDIQEAVELDRRSRVYVVVAAEGKGRYLVGRRKGAPWEGFGENGQDEVDEGK